jgi:hypothetical protein
LCLASFASAGILAEARKSACRTLADRTAGEIALDRAPNIDRPDPERRLKLLNIRRKSVLPQKYSPLLCKIAPAMMFALIPDVRLHRCSQGRADAYRRIACLPFKPAVPEVPIAASPDSARASLRGECRERGKGAIQSRRNLQPTCELRASSKRRRLDTHASVKFSA